MCDARSETRVQPEIRVVKKVKPHFSPLPYLQCKTRPLHLGYFEPERVEVLTMMEEPDRLLRMEEILAMLGISESTLRRMIDEGRFPKPIYIAQRSPRWWRSEILKWIESLV